MASHILMTFAAFANEARYLIPYVPVGIIVYLDLFRK